MATIEEWVKNVLDGDYKLIGHLSDRFSGSCYNCNKDDENEGEFSIDVVVLPGRLVFGSDYFALERGIEWSSFYFDLCQPCINVNALQSMYKRVRHIIEAYNEHRKNVALAIKESEWIPQWSAIPMLIQDYCNIEVEYKGFT